MDANLVAAHPLQFFSVQNDAWQDFRSASVELDPVHIVIVVGDYGVALWRPGCERLEFMVGEGRPLKVVKDP